MNVIAKICQGFYGLAIVVYGVQQLIYGDFRNVQIPAWQLHIPFLPVWAYLTGIALIVAGAAIIWGKRGREAALMLGVFFLFLFLFVHVPYQFFGEVHSSLHLGVWIDALKEFALAGGAFVIAGSYPANSPKKVESLMDKRLSLFIPFCVIFYCVTMSMFGAAHFMYAENVATLLPPWFPDPIFWTYFGGVALIASGVAIILKIRQGAVAMLLCMMLLGWFFLLHLPRAIADPFVHRGNEISSACDALAFAGIAGIISLAGLKSDLRLIFKPGDTTSMLS